VARAEAYLRVKWHLDPSRRLATTDMERTSRRCHQHCWLAYCCALVASIVHFTDAGRDVRVKFSSQKQSKTLKALTGCRTDHFVADVSYLQFPLQVCFPTAVTELVFPISLSVATEDSYPVALNVDL